MCVAKDTGADLEATLDITETLELLPSEIRDLVQGLPEEEARRLLRKLIVQSEINFRPLEEKDLQSIKERTTGSYEFGFKSVDVDITWTELSSQNYISLGAFADHDGAQVPVAFIVAELCALPPEGHGRGAGEFQASSSVRGSAVVRGEPPPLRVEPEELRTAMLAAGCRGPQDVAVAVWYIGVSYEYRRQGLGSQLLDLVREVGEEAGAKALWLHVAEYNPNAIAFYSRYGLTATPDVYKQGDCGRHQLMHMVLEPAAAAAAAAARGNGEGASCSPSSSSLGSPAFGMQSANRGFGGSDGGGSGGGGAGGASSSRGSKKKSGGNSRGGRKRRALPACGCVAADLGATGVGPVAAFPAGQDRGWSVPGCMTWGPGIGRGPVVAACWAGRFRTGSSRAGASEGLGRFALPVFVAARCGGVAPAALAQLPAQRRPGAPSAGAARVKALTCAATRGRAAGQSLMVL